MSATELLDQLKTLPAAEQQAFARLLHEWKSRQATAPSNGKPVKVDFAAQLRKTWGQRVFSEAQVADMRAAELEGEEG